MKSLLSGRFSIRYTIVVGAFLALACAYPFASAQTKPAGDPHKTRLEYTMVSVVRTDVSETMGNLDKEGWQVFQVVPVWKIGNDNGSGELEAIRYDVFAKRPLEAKP